MAIVKMKKITAVAMKKDKNELLRELMWLSSVDLVPLSERLEDPKWSGLKVSGDNVDLEELKNKEQLLNETENILSRYAKRKSLFDPKKDIYRNDFESFEADDKGIFELAEKALERNDRLGRLHTEKNKIMLEKQSFSYWAAFDFSFEKLCGEYTSCWLGSLPSSAGYEKACDFIDSLGLGCCLEKIRAEKERCFVIAVFLRSEENEVSQALTEIRFSRMVFDDPKGTSVENIERLDKLLAEIDEEENNLLGELESFSSRLSEIEKAIDIVSNYRSALSASEKFLNTEECFALEGYVPEKRQEKLIKILEPFECFYEFEDPSKDDDVPVLLSNNSLVTPFESVTEMYSLPVYSGIDPNFAVAPFYFIAFGMMLSDAGYGLIIALACAIGIRFMNFGRKMKNNLKMFMLCGISTMFWGAMFGTFFGDSVGVISSVYFGGNAAFRPLWFDPVENPLNLLILAIILGYLQIMCALCIKFYLIKRDDGLLSAIFDAGFWMLILIGLPMLVLGGIFATVGGIIALVSVAGLILTQGRKEKNIFLKLIKGVSSLYDITGYLADLLSYSRILALGLSAGVIGSVFNKLGSIGGSGIFSFILFVIIFLIGHTLNLALSTLGSYIHAARLQFIEFFGRFYESGGKPYDAVAVEGKYNDIYEEKSEKRK